MKWLLCFLVLWLEVVYSLPFTVIPKEGTQLPTTIAVGSSVMAYYTVINNTNSQRNGNYVKYLPPNVTQVVQGGTYPDTLGSTFDLGPGESGTLQLNISGSVYANDQNPHHHLFVSFPKGLTCSGTSFPLQVLSLQDYKQWITSLSPSYQVLQGAVAVFDQELEDLSIEVFNSSFANNSATPYIIPELPIEGTELDPYYAPPFNTPGPNGSTVNIGFKVSDEQALVSIISFPPKAAYCGYQTYLFCSEASNYIDITSPFERTVSPDPNRYEIFGSLGDAINNRTIAEQYTNNPWGQSIVMYITTSNSNLANALISSATAYGIDPRSIFVEKIGSNVITGRGLESDDFVTLMRYALPEDDDTAENWRNNLSSNMLVYRVTNEDLFVSRFGAESYKAHTINVPETTFSPSLYTALTQLATLMQNYLEEQQHSPATYKETRALSVDNSEGVPTDGYVGSNCIAYGFLCLGDSQDTSTYAAVDLNFLNIQQTAFIIGVNHTVTAMDNTEYLDINVNNALIQTSFGDIAQTNVASVGFSSGILNGSVPNVLNALGISIPLDNVELIANLNNLYITFVTRDIDNPTISAIPEYGINLEGVSQIPLDAPLTIFERTYLLPGSTVGGNENFMIYPFVIADELSLE